MKATRSAGAPPTANTARQPIVRAHGVVDDGGEEGAEVVAGVHPRGALLAARFGPLLGDEDAADGPLAADADSRQEAKGGELPDGHGGAAQEGEERSSRGW